MHSVSLPPLAFFARRGTRDLSIEVPGWTMSPARRQPDALRGLTRRAGLLSFSRPNPHGVATRHGHSHRQRVIDKVRSPVARKRLWLNGAA